ncbi:MAG: hypothetical protein KAT68_05920 [Bacteroidales bacterium]|nr:hypothetical protein [Bacteroidales bacterium]
MNKLLILKYIVLINLFLFGCISDSNNDKSIEDKINGDSSIDDEYMKKAKFIFYSMSSPIEMAGIFHNAGAIYEPEILNPTINAENYSTSYKAALNLGIYGVDLSYTRMFDQLQESINYLAAIKQLADVLGVPEEYVSFTAENIEKSIKDKDSLMLIATNAYSSTDIYLKSGERENSAALIILGGWIEALYVALNIFDEKTPDRIIMERIAEQKYSLNSLIALLSNFSNDLQISEYILMLKKLKKVYDTFEIYFEQGDVDIDTVNQVISLNRNRIDVSVEQILEIKSIIKSIRAKIIE